MLAYLTPVFAWCVRLCRLHVSGTIHCLQVIHQPREGIYDLLDDVIWLARGGFQVYSGPRVGATSEPVICTQKTLSCLQALCQEYFRDVMGVVFSEGQNPSDVSLPDPGRDCGFHDVSGHDGCD